MRQAVAIGRHYEREAGHYLERQGYAVLAYNFQSYAGEIDIVAKDGEYLVFVEVKYRNTLRGGHPLETVDKKKRERVRKAAAIYCLQHGKGHDIPCRFDVIGILGEDYYHVRNAF